MPPVLLSLRGGAKFWGRLFHFAIALRDFRRALKANRYEKLAAKHAGCRKREHLFRWIAKYHGRLLIDVDHLIHRGFPTRSGQSLAIEIDDDILVRRRKC